MSRISEIKQEIADYEELINANVPQDEKDFAKDEIKELKEELAKLEAKATPSEPKKKVEPKAPKSKSEPRAKAEPKSEPKSSAKAEYDCDDLIAEAKKRKVKAKANAQKRANAPKKSPSTKTKEAVEKTATRVEKSVETRAKKGEVKVEELEKLIAEYQDAIKKLQALLLKVKSGKKFARGGKMGVMDAESSKEYNDIKEHSCGCGDKMAKGGMVKHGLRVGDEIISSEDNIVVVRNNSDMYEVNLNQGTRIGLAKSGENKGNFKMITRKRRSKTYGKSMENGGELIGKQKNLDRNKNGRIDSEDLRMIRENKMANGGFIGQELMGGQPNQKSPSGAILLYVLKNGKEIVVTEDDGETKELYVKSNGFSGYTLHYNNNQYEFAYTLDEDEESMARGGGVKARKSVAIDKKYSALKRGRRVSERYAYVDMKNGETYRRRNANQHGKTKGGGVYYEHHENRVDNKKFLADGGNIEVVNIGAKERMDYIKTMKNRDTTREERDKIVDKALTYEKDGKKYFSIAYDKPSKGESLTKHRALIFARKIKKAKPNYEVIIKEISGNFFADYNPRYRGAVENSNIGYTVLISPKLPSKVSEMILGTDSFEDGGNTY